MPVLGHLFRYDSVVSRRTELLIILTPHVVRSAEDAERIKQIEAARMNWCLADVHALHGVEGLCVGQDCPICDAQTPVIYPDFSPRGLEPGATPPAEMLPTSPQGEVYPGQRDLPGLPPPDLRPPPAELPAPPASLDAPRGRAAASVAPQAAVQRAGYVPRTPNAGPVALPQVHLETPRQQPAQQPMPATATTTAPPSGKRNSIFDIFRPQR